MMPVLCLVLLNVVVNAQTTQPSAAASATGRAVFSFNQNWRFERVDGAADDTAGRDIKSVPSDQLWPLVCLPHTVRLEPRNANGGENFQGLCWYSRHFVPPLDWQNKVVCLRFEGAMQVADLWLNGQWRTTHFGGYLPFTVDITKSLKLGVDNQLMIRLSNTDNREVPPGKPQNQLDFTYFGGLYRDVDLIVTDRVHITDEMLANQVAGGGVFVSYPTITDAAATVRVQTQVTNDGEQPQPVTVAAELLDPTGKSVAEADTPIALTPVQPVTADLQLHVQNPRLWHPDHPDLYTLVVSVRHGPSLLDRVRTRIGLRTIAFNTADGMLINGRKFLSIGCNRHQDHPYVGYALSDHQQYRDVKRLREAGFTSIRSHYPQDRAFLDACDELGMLVIESNPGWQTGGDAVFTQRVYQNAREMIRRDRNRPSVILWEAQLNETYAYNAAHFADLQKIVHDEYPFDPCFTAGDSVEKKPGGQDWDVVYNYAKNDKPHWQREYGDSVDNWGDQQSVSRVARGWGETPMLVQAWRHATVFNQILAPVKPGAAALAGVDIWAGVDAYRGYHHQPFLGGPFDLFRLPKFDAWFFQSQRPVDVHVNGLDDGPMVYIANFCTFQSPSTITVFSNCQQVRLWQNGKEVGTSDPIKQLGNLPHPPFTFTIGQTNSESSTMFMTGVAQPGTRVGELKAEGIINGKVVTTQIVRAPGVPRQVVLQADMAGPSLTADGSDWIRVYARVCDARGGVCPYADDQITFQVSGEGELITDLHAANNPVPAEAGIATALVRASVHAGPITIRASGFGLKDGVTTVTTTAPTTPVWP